MKRVVIIASVLLAASAVGQPLMTAEIFDGRQWRAGTNDTPALAAGLALRFSLNAPAYRAGDAMVVSCRLSNVASETVVLLGASFDSAHQFHYFNGEVSAEFSDRATLPPVPSPIKLRPGASLSVSNTYTVPKGFDLSAWQENRKQLVTLRNRLAATFHSRSMSSGEVARLLDAAYPTSALPCFDFWTFLNVSTASGGKTNYITAWPKWLGIPIRDESQSQMPENTARKLAKPQG